MNVAIDEIEMMAMIVIDEIANDPWSWPTVSDDPLSKRRQVCLKRSEERWMNETRGSGDGGWVF